MRGGGLGATASYLGAAATQSGVPHDFGAGVRLSGDRILGWGPRTRGFRPISGRGYHGEGIVSRGGGRTTRGFVRIRGRPSWGWGIVLPTNWGGADLGGSPIRGITDPGATGGIL